MNKEILYKIEVIYGDLVKNYPDKVRFISNDKNMANGTIYLDYDIKNFRFIQTYVSDNFNIFDKYKEQEDKIINLQEENQKLKETNEEHRKINGDLRKENQKLVKVIDTILDFNFFKEECPLNFGFEDEKENKSLDVLYEDEWCETNCNDEYKKCWLRYFNKLTELKGGSDEKVESEE